MTNNPERLPMLKANVPPHGHRYTWQGWGLISVVLERRSPPGTWHWQAVGSHARRLQRVLRKYQ